MPTVESASGIRHSAFRIPHSAFSRSGSFVGRADRRIAACARDSRDSRDDQGAPATRRQRDRDAAVDAGGARNQTNSEQFIRRAARFTYPR
ncbi:hypothetical protein [Burkholderia sp. BE17]|uniref:hypothetical protein n=1 Tax=Burkholderia sp. BE17 TaxID=2656644 RepID=UPI00128D1891|nr:hypothetical protein [Burkholderia sp. BE17]MPV68548.1 hypothetical protein [Burkholderia sp. BE17]